MKSPIFLGIFGTAPGKCRVLVENVAISRGGTKKTKQTKDFGVLGKQRHEESNFFGYFWYRSRKMQGFGGKRCHLLRRYQKLKIEV